MILLESVNVLTAANIVATSVSGWTIIAGYAFCKGNLK